MTLRFAQDSQRPNLKASRESARALCLFDDDDNDDY